MININRVIGFSKLIIISITSNCLWLFLICKKFNAQALFLDYKIIRINPKSTISLQHIKLILVLIYSTHYLSVFMYLFRVFVSFIHVILQLSMFKNMKIVANQIGVSDHFILWVYCSACVYCIRLIFLTKHITTHGYSYFGKCYQQPVCIQISNSAEVYFFSHSIFCSIWVDAVFIVSSYLRPWSFC